MNFTNSIKEGLKKKQNIKILIELKTMDPINDI